MINYFLFKVLSFSFLFLYITDSASCRSPPEKRDEVSWRQGEKCQSNSLSTERKPCFEVVLSNLHQLKSEVSQTFHLCNYPIYFPVFIRWTSTVVTALPSLLSLPNTF